MLIICFLPAILKFKAVQTSGRFLESPRWIYKCGQQFSEIPYFLLGERQARCKCFSEMNLQIVNITGEMLTILADFCSFVRNFPICRIIYYIIYISAHVFLIKGTLSQKQFKVLVFCIKQLLVLLVVLWDNFDFCQIFSRYSRECQLISVSCTMEWRLGGVSYHCLIHHGMVTWRCILHCR